MYKRAGACRLYIGIRAGFKSDSCKVHIPGNPTQQHPKLLSIKKTGRPRGRQEQQLQLPNPHICAFVTRIGFCGFLIIVIV